VTASAPSPPAPPAAAASGADGLLGGSAVLLVATNLANVLHFAFHLAMARLLGPADYGLLAALFATLYVFGVVAESVQTVVARQTARASSLAEVRALLRGGLPAVTRVALLLLGLYAAASLPLASMLRVPLSVLAVFALAAEASVLVCVARGAQLGLRRFGAFGGNLLFEASVKVGGGVAAVWLGWGLHGATGAVSLSLLLAVGVGAWSLRDVLRAAATPAPPSGAAARGHALSVLVATATMMAFYSVDVVLARTLFPAPVAGQYSLAALIGKGVLLGTLPLARAMFPLAARADRSPGSWRVLAATLGLLAACLAPALAVVALWPQRLARLAGGPGYEAAANILLPVAAAFSLMAVSHTLVLFRLAASQPRFAGWMALTLAGEVALLVACRGSLVTVAHGVLAAHAGFLAAAALFAFAPDRRSQPTRSSLAA
jgi:O-antigen/teichoic acid export membrane protein